MIRVCSILLLVSSVFAQSDDPIQSIPDPQVREAMLQARAAAPKLARMERDIVWAQVDDEHLTLDVFVPEGTGPFPIVVWVHGGGFTGLWKEWVEYPARLMASHGYTVFNVNYRLAPKHKFPAAVNDCLGAVVWAKKNAHRYAGDPMRVAVVGESAGGTLAAMVAYGWQDRRFSPTGRRPGDPDASVRAVIPIYAVFDFSELTEERFQKMKADYLGAGVDPAAASPVAYLTDRAVPTMLVVGDLDAFYQHSLKFKEKLDKLGVPNDLFIGSQGAHGFILLQWDQKTSQDAYTKMREFLDRRLKH